MVALGGIIMATFSLFLLEAGASGTLFWSEQYTRI